MDTIRVVRPREVVTTKTVIDSYEYPCINLCSGWVTVEVLKDGQVALDGVLIRGSRVGSHRLLGYGSFSGYCVEVCVMLPNGAGSLTINAHSLVYLDSNMPTGAKLVEKGEEEEK